MFYYGAALRETGVVKMKWKKSLFTELKAKEDAKKERKHAACSSEKKTNRMMA